MKKRLQEMLEPKRFRHSLGVSETAEEMAKRFGADPEKARIAGLLHDCAKNLSDEEMLEKCRQLHLTLSAVEFSNKALIHAPLGAAVAQTEFGIQDREILHAIACHTVGAEHMTLLDKIIYTADMIEPSRDFPGVDKLRETSKRDLDETVFLCVEATVQCNLARRALIHPATVEMWNALLLGKKRR